MGSYHKSNYKYSWSSRNQKSLRAYIVQSSFSLWCWPYNCLQASRFFCTSKSQPATLSKNIPTSCSYSLIL